MKKLILLTFSLFMLSGCYKNAIKKGMDIGYKRGIGEGFENGQKQGYNNGYRVGFREGTEEGKTQASIEYNKKVNNSLVKANQDLLKNFKFDLIKGSQLYNAFLATENGNNKLLDVELNKLGKDIFALIEKGLADNRYNISTTQRKRINTVLEKGVYDISSDVTKTFRSSLNSQVLTFPKSQRFVVSSYYSTKADIIANAVNTHICSFSPMIFSAMGAGLPYPSDFAISQVLQRPCEALLISIAKIIGDSIHKSGLIKDLELTTTTINYTGGGAIAELSTAYATFFTKKEYVINRSLLGLEWKGGYIKVAYRAVIKAGIDLQNGFSIRRDDNTNTLFIKIPKAKILDTILERSNTEFEDGGFRDIDGNKFNWLDSEAKRAVTLMAERSNLYRVANQNVQLILTELFKPLTQNSFSPYKIEFEESIDTKTKI